MIKISIGNATSRIIGSIPEEVHKELDLLLSHSPKNAHHIKSVKEGRWDGIFHLYQKTYGQSFPTGLLSFAVRILEKHNIKVIKEDNRIRPDVNLPHLTFTPFDGYQKREYQQFTIDRAYSRTRGLLKMATGAGKCLGRGTKVMMFDGSTKNVEDVKVGDLLMGPDSKSREVLSTSIGVGPLYKVHQNNGDDFVCNDEHILCLQRTGSPSKKWVKGKEIEITAKKFHESSKYFKHTHKGYKVPVNFIEQNTPIDPYFLGLWLGDGSSREVSITTGDQEIKNYLYEFAEKWGYNIREIKEKGNCNSYALVINTNREWKGRHPIRTNLKKLNLLLNKHIPDIYKFNNKESRLSLLAGLMDSDGYIDKRGTGATITVVNKKLATDICWLARSLGFRSSLNEKIASIKKINYKTKAYTVRISGNLSIIPNILPRRKGKNKTKYNSLRYGIELEPIGEGEYFGFSISGDRKFLLGDFTVTHNTLTVAEIIGKIKTGPFMFYVLTQDLMDQAYEALSSTLNEPIGMIGGGVFDVKKINVCTIQTAVRAVNLKNRKFKISDYKFDEEDIWAKEEFLKEDKLEVLQKLIYQSKGLYVDECHHVSSRSIQDVLNASPNAFWRYGGTATPYREDGAEILIQASFGKKIVDISASYLIEKGFLVEPYIIFEPIFTNCPFDSYQKIYPHCISKNPEFNTHVADQANFLIQNGMSVLVLVQHIQHGKSLEKLIDGAYLVTSKLTKKNRREIIQKMRDGEIKCMIGTSLADEGLDIPVIDAVLMAGGGASSTRVHQRIGRALRINKLRKNAKALIIYYHHHQKYLDKHAKKALKIMKTEPKFNIIKSKGKDLIFKEISEVMGFEHKEKTIFDL